MESNICPCCKNGNLEFIRYNYFIEAGEDKIVGEYVCSNCLKDFISTIDIKDLDKFCMKVKNE